MVLSSVTMIFKQVLILFFKEMISSPSYHILFKTKSTQTETKPRPRSPFLYVAFEFIERKKTGNLLICYPVRRLLKIFPSRFPSSLSLMQSASFHMHAKTNNQPDLERLICPIDISPPGGIVGHVCGATLFPLLFTPRTNTYERGTCRRRRRRAAIRKRRNNAERYHPAESRLKSTPLSYKCTQFSRQAMRKTVSNNAPRNIFYHCALFLCDGERDVSGHGDVFFFIFSRERSSIRCYKFFRVSLPSRWTSVYARRAGIFLSLEKKVTTVA